MSLAGPGSTQVVVQTEICGVCASDLPVWRDAQPRYPIRLGHEPTGIVLEVGASVVGLRAGDRVTGQVEGTFSEHFVAEAEDLVIVPSSIDPGLALGEPLGCMVEADRRTRIDPGQRVAIVGLGFMGLGLLQLIRRRRPARLIAIDPRAEARARALAFGADEAIRPDEVRSADVVDRVDDWTKPRGHDVVIEASGTQAGLELAGRLVRAHGTLSIFGYHQGGPRLVDMEMWNWKAIDVVNAHVRDRRLLHDAIERGLGLMADGAISFETLVSHRLSLAQVDAAFGALSVKAPGFSKAVITVSGGGRHGSKAG